MYYDDQERDTQLVKLLGEKFIQRKDVKARQTPDGEWMPVRQDPKDSASKLMPWTMMDFELHLSGQASYGHYLLDEDSMCKFFAFDIDVLATRPKTDTFEGEFFHYTDAEGERHEIDPRTVWVFGADGDPAKEFIRRQLRNLAEGLAKAIWRIFEGQVKVLVSDTGAKGLHVYGVPATGAIEAKIMRDLANGVLSDLGGFEPQKGNNFFRYANPDYPEAFHLLEVEVFPKQDTLPEGGFGNLMALPLGVNRKTDRHRPFVTFRGLDRSGGWVALDPIEAMTEDCPWAS